MSGEMIAILGVGVALARKALNSEQRQTLTDEAVRAVPVKT